MLPVNSSDPATTTRMRPRVNTPPVASVIRPPHVAGSRPAETVMANRPPNAMYAPARKPATSCLSQGRCAFSMPFSVATSVIAFGSLNAMSQASTHLCGDEHARLCACMYLSLAASRAVRPARPRAQPFHEGRLLHAQQHSDTIPTVEIGLDAC